MPAAGHIVAATVVSTCIHPSCQFDPLLPSLPSLLQLHCSDASQPLAPSSHVDRLNHPVLLAEMSFGSFLADVQLNQQRQTDAHMDEQ